MVYVCVPRAGARAVSHSERAARSRWTEQRRRSRRRPAFFSNECGGAGPLTLSLSFSFDGPLAPRKPHVSGQAACAPGRHTSRTPLAVRISPRQSLPPDGCRPCAAAGCCRSRVSAPVPCPRPAPVRPAATLSQAAPHGASRTRRRRGRSSRPARRRRAAQAQDVCGQRDDPGRPGRRDRPPARRLWLHPGDGECVAWD